MSTRRRRLWLCAAAILFLADIFLHLPITDFCDGLVKRFGFLPFDATVRRGFIALGAVSLCGAWTWRKPQRTIAAPAMLGLLAISIAAQATIVLNAIEDVHYPQYALMAVTLAPALPTLEAAWLGATGLGAVDELYQFLELPRGTPSYFDWNDVVLNAIGAAFGIAIAILLWRRTADRMVSTRVVIAAAAIAVGVLAWAPPAAPFYTMTPGGRRFHKMAASEAIVTLVALWAGVRYLAARRAGGPSPTAPAT